MGESPGALYRTTGSTLLHPLSGLLGIPLDQVRLRAGARGLWDSGVCAGAGDSRREGMEGSSCRGESPFLATPCICLGSPGASRRHRPPRKSLR